MGFSRFFGFFGFSANYVINFCFFLICCFDFFLFCFAYNHLFFLNLKPYLLLFYQDQKYLANYLDVLTILQLMLLAPFPKIYKLGNLDYLYNQEFGFHSSFL